MTGGQNKFVCEIRRIDRQLDNNIKVEREEKERANIIYYLNRRRGGMYRRIRDQTFLDGFLFAVCGHLNGLLCGFRRES